MPKLVGVETRTLGDVFSGGRRFRLPWFQRAYSWQTREAARLLGDMLDGLNKQGDSEFFLGTLMLADESGKDGLSIVDGHQRLMTLTILFAALRDLEPDPDSRAWLDGHIAETSEKGRLPRLVPQTGAFTLLEEAVQRPGATVSDGANVWFDEDLSESERRILEVRDFMVARLSQLRGGDDQRRKLARFLESRCRVILQIFDSEDYAWTALNIEEDTRLPFDRGASAKATLLSVVPPEARERASSRWEACEERVGAKGMGELVGHIRTLRSRRRSDKPVEHDLCRLFDLEHRSAEFIDGWLVPNAERYAKLKAASRGVGPLPGEVRAAIDRMTWIDAELWMPAGLRWLELHGIADASGPLFFRRLDRLVWMMKLGGIDPPLMKKRIIDVVDEIDRTTDPAAVKALEIERALMKDAIENLRAQNFCGKWHAGSVLRRLCALMGEDPGPVEKKSVTIEHILPRNPPKGSRWWVHFPSIKDVKAHVNRLGNLTFLHPDDNQAAGNKDWVEKRVVLSRASFAMTRNSCAPKEWTRQAIIDRTEALIVLLMRDFELAE